MDHEEVRTELDQVAVRLQEDGLAPGASAEERQCHLWRQLVRSEAERSAVDRELQNLRGQQASEMTEVESYVEHIRGLLEERESLTAEYERDNEQLRLELQHSRLHTENQGREMLEMLAQEGLGEMGLSSPSEQVAYLLVERATLLERLEAVERRLDDQSITGRRGGHLEDELEPLTLEEQRESLQTTRDHMTTRDNMQTTRDNMTKSPTQSPWRKLFSLRRSAQNSAPVHSETTGRERAERQRLEQDLEEASRRLAMAHQDIRRLTGELDAARSHQGLSGPELERAGHEVETLRREVDKLKHCDMVELQRNREQNQRLDGEVRVLRERVRALDAEKNQLLETVAKSDGAAVKEKDLQEGDGPQSSPTAPSAEDQDLLHKRCRAAQEDGLVQLRELQRRLQRQRAEQEEVVERNEELEALLGETQNTAKEERQRHDAEREGLHRRIKSLEAELKRQSHEQVLTDGDGDTNSYLQQLRGGGQERAALLEARLTEEKDWRKQLEVDLNTAQTALKKDKEALQVGERERQKLRMEVNGLQTECQQGKTLIKSLTQVRGEKGILEEKVAQLERSQSRLHTELECHREGGWAHEDLRETRLQLEQLREKAERLTAELATLKTEHNSLRDDMAAERLQSSELQAELSSSVQERLAAEGERERLGLEVGRLQERLQGAETARRQAEAHAALRDPCPAGRPPDEGYDQLACLRRESVRLQSTLEEERLLASQHQLALQAQVKEAQARTKSQDSVLGQKAEEAKQLKQDLQRVQSLFTSAERELRYEREKGLDLKRHNTLLEQEKLKLCAELKQTQAKLAQAELSVQGQAGEVERQQQRLREQEVELARTATSRTTSTGLQGELRAERERLVAADRKAVELQQQLKAVQHQLRVEEARSGESSRLERDSRDLSDALSALRAQQQEELITRKLLEQREEELQQQVGSLRLKEASLNRSHSELSHRAHQLETRLGVLEEEGGRARQEHTEGQRSCHRLRQQLDVSQQENDRLQGELQTVLLQLDAHIRKYNEKQSQHKSKLRQAKHVFLKATTQRDRALQRLEHELQLANSLALKEKEWIRTVTQENEKLLVERRDLLRRMSEAEEQGSTGMRTANTTQHRVNFLEVENRQLQDRTLKLSNQVSSLERALRNVQSYYSLEQDVKKMFACESVPVDGILHTSTLSLTSGVVDPLGFLDALCRVKVGVAEGTRASSFSNAPSQLSELGYLNLTSPAAPPDPPDPGDTPGGGGEQGGPGR